MTARFVVTVLLGSLLLPGPADFASIGGPSERCARFCRDDGGGGKFEYRRHLSYVYDYRADTISSVSGVTKNESRLHLSATVNVSPLSKCDFVMQLHNVLLEESSPGNISQRNPVSRMEDFSRLLQRAPLKFSFQDGKVEELCASGEDVPWVLNVKRGILSAFQNSMDDFGHKATVLETDVTGTCDTEYSASSGSEYPVVVTKVKDLTSCDHHYTGSHSIPSVSYNRGQGLPFVKSEQKCEQRINEDNVLEKSICEEVHLFRPFSNGDNGVATRVLQMMLLREVIPARGEPSPERLSLTKTTMLYQHPDSEALLQDEEGRVTSLLKQLEGSVRHGVDATTPELFSQLVAALKATGYPQLAKVFSRVINPVQRKFLLDAMPYVHTADGMTVVTDLFRSGEIKPEELDSWLTSLTFQKKPSLNMLTAVSPLLDLHPRQKAVLGITSMVHNYCQLDPNCLEKPTVRNLVSKTEKLVGSSKCRVDSTHSAEDLITALKGIGNMGLVASRELLTTCHQKENPVEVRLAAIAATRRTPCLTEHHQELLRLFSDASEDVEVRIAAYQAVMRCPSYDTVALVKSLLLKEEVNQVGSYVWTHLTNLRGTKSRWKQGIKELLLDDFLQKKFSTDARTFSRNYELSTPLGSAAARASAEADVVFTPASFLPRSVALNLTVDLFGESLNLLELGGRAEGFEGLLEELLGPGGGEGGSKPSKARAAGEPRWSLYARVLGAEVAYRRFQGLPSVAPPSLLGQGLRYNKTFSLVHAAYSVPTACGFPLELSVDGNAAVQLEVRGRLDAVSVEGRLAPSAAVEVVGTMAVDALVARSGVVSVSTLHTNTYVDGVLRVEGGRLVDVQVNTPRRRSDVLEASSRLFLLHDGTRLPVSSSQPKEERLVCSSEAVSRAVGMQLCTELVQPLGGLKVVLFKTDTFDSYQFRYALRNERHSKQLLVALDTPGSSVDRKLRASLDYDAKKGSLEADVRSPAFRARAQGKVSDDGVEATVSLDGEELLALNAGLTEAAGPQRLLEPRLYLALRKTHVLLDAVARVLYVHGSRYKATLEVNGLLGSATKVLDVSADLTMERRAYTVSGSFECPKLRGNFEGAYRSDKESVNSHARVEYSGEDGGPAKVLEMATKLRNVHNADSVAKSLQFHLRLPDLEDYNTKVRWQLEYGDRLLEHRALLLMGKNSWETAQEFRCRTSPEGHVDFRLMAMLLGSSHDIDYKFDTKLQMTESVVETYVVAHRTSGRRYAALLKYRASEELRATLALPDLLEFHLDSACSRRRPPGDDGDGAGLVLRADSNVTYVTAKGVTRTRALALRGDYVTSNQGRDHDVRVALDGVLVGTLTATLSAGGAATQTVVVVVVEAAGSRYAQTLLYRYHRGHSLTVTVETPARNYTGDIWASWTEEEKALSVDLQLSKRFTFNTKVVNTDVEDSAELEMLWDAALILALQVKSVEGEHGLLAHYRGSHVNATVSTPAKGVSARVSWGDADAEETASLDADWETLDGLNAVLKTPFRGLEAQELRYAYRRPDDASAALEIRLRWHEGRDEASLKATGVSARLETQASVAFHSTLASLDDVALRVTHRRSSAAEGHDGAELLLDGRRFTADASWRTDAGGVAVNASFGDSASPEGRFVASLEYAGPSGRLELSRGAERRFLSAYSLRPGDVAAALETPVPWLRRVEAHARYTDVAVDAGVAFNEHTASLQLDARFDDEWRFVCSATFLSTLTDAATLRLVHEKTPDGVLDDVYLTLGGVSVATLKLRASGYELEAAATFPGHSVATELRAGDGMARGRVAWNQDEASLELVGRPGHYEAALASSRLPRELRVVLDHRRDASGCETRAALGDSYGVAHTLRLHAHGWNNEVIVTTPAGVASVTDTHDDDATQLRHRLRADVYGVEASLGVEVDRDAASGTLERAKADVATPWAAPATLSFSRDARDSSVSHELELRYGDGRQVKVTSAVAPGSLELRVEAPRMRPVQVSATASPAGAALTLLWEDKALEARATLDAASCVLTVATSDDDEAAPLVHARLSRGPGRLEAELRCPWLQAAAAADLTNLSVDVQASANTSVPGLERLALEGSWKTPEDSRGLDLALTRNSDYYALASYFRYSGALCDVLLDVNTNTDVLDNVTLGAGWSLRPEEYRAGAYMISQEPWRMNATWTSEEELSAGEMTLTLETPLPEVGDASATLRYVDSHEVTSSLRLGAWRVDLAANRSSEAGNLEARVCDHRLSVAASFPPGGVAHVSFLADRHSLEVSARLDAHSAEAELRSASLGLAAPVRARVTRRRDDAVAVSVTSGGTSLFEFDADASARLRLVLGASLDVGASWSLAAGAGTPSLALHLARDGLNNTVTVVVNDVDVANASVAALVSLPSWSLPRYALRAGYDATALPKALTVKVTRDATTPLSLDFTMKRNSVNAFLRSDVLDSLVWTLRGNFDLDSPTKYVEAKLDGGAAVHLEGRASFSDLASEVELDLEALKVHALYDARESRKTAKLVLVTDGANFDLVFAGNLAPDSGFASLNVSGTGMDLVRLGVSYDLVDKVAVNVSVVVNNRQHEVAGRFLVDASRLQLLLETPSPLLRKLNVSSSYADDETLSLALLYLGIGASAQPAQLLVWWEDADIRVEAARVGVVQSLEARLRYASLDSSLVTLSAATRDRESVRLKLGVDADRKVVAELLLADSFDLSFVCDSRSPLSYVRLSVKDSSTTVFGWKSHVIEGLNGELVVEAELEALGAKHAGVLESTFSQRTAFRASLKSTQFPGEYGARLVYEASSKLEAVLTSPGKRLALRCRRDGSRIEVTLETPFQGLEKLAADGALRKLDRAGAELSASVSVNERRKLGLQLGYMWKSQLKNLTLSLSNETDQYKVRGRLVNNGKRVEASVNVWTPSSSVKALVEVNTVNMANVVVRVDVDRTPKVLLQYRYLKADKKSVRHSTAVVDVVCECLGVSLKASATATASSGNASLSIRTPSLAKTADANWDVGRREALLSVDGERLLVLERRTLSVALPGKDAAAVLLLWDVADDAVDASVTLSWDGGAQVLRVQGGVRKSPLAFNFQFTSPYQNFRRVSLSSELTTSPDLLKGDAVLHWNHDAPVVEVSTFVKRLKMTSSLQLNVHEKRFSVDAAYDLDAPSKVVSLELVDGARLYSWRGSFSPNQYVNAEVDMAAVFDGRHYRASATYDVREDPVTAALLVRLEDAVNSVNLSLSRDQEVQTLFADLALGSVCARRWSLECSYDASSGLGFKGEVARDGQRHLAATLKVLPRFVWLEVNTPFSGFENLTAETVLLGGDSVKVARVSAHWGYGDALELHLGSKVLDNSSVDVDARLASPWTGNVTLLGSYSNHEDHVVRLRVLRAGETEALVDGSLVLHAHKHKFSFEMACTLEFLGSTKLDVGYDISQTSKKVYFNGTLDSYTLSMVAEGSLSEAQLAGQFLLETPFAALSRLEALLDVARSLSEASVVVHRDAAVVYEARFSGETVDDESFLCSLTLCAPGACLRDVQLWATLSADVAEVRLRHAGREARVVVGGDAATADVLTLRASLKGFLRHDASVTLRADRDRPRGELSVGWNNEEKRLGLTVSLMPRDFRVDLRTPFDALHTLNLGWNLHDGDLHHHIRHVNANVTLNNDTLALDARLWLRAPGRQFVAGSFILNGRSLASLSASLLQEETSLVADASLTTPMTPGVLSSGVALRWDDGWHGNFSLLTPYLLCSVDATRAALLLSVNSRDASLRLRAARDDHSASFDLDATSPRPLQVRGTLLLMPGGRATLRLEAPGVDADVSLAKAGSAVAVSVDDRSWTASYSVGHDQVAASLDLAHPRASLDLIYARGAGKLSYALGDASGRLQVALSGKRVGVDVAVTGAPRFSTELTRDAQAWRWYVDVADRRLLMVDWARREDGVATLSGLVDADSTGRHDAEVRYSDAMDFIKLRLDASVDVELQVRPDAGSFVVKMADCCSHELSYTVSQDSWMAALSFSSAAEGRRQHRATLRLLRRGEVDLEVLSDGRVVLGLRASASVGVAEVRGAASLDVLGAQSGVAVRHRRVFPLASEVNLTSAGRQVVRALVSADAGSVEASVVLDEAAPPLLQASLRRRGAEGFQLLLRALHTVDVSARVDAHNLDAALDVEERLSARVRLSPASLSSHLRLPSVEWRCDVPLAVADAMALNVTLAYAGVRHGVHAVLDNTARLLGVVVGVETAGRKGDALLRLDYENRTLAARLATPFPGYERLELELNPVLDLDGARARSYVRWGDAQVQLSHALLFHDARLLLDAQLTTPFHDFNRLSLRLEYENAERKALVALARLPGQADAVGLEVDWLVRGPGDLRVRTSLALPAVPRLGVALRSEVSMDKVSAFAALDVAAWSLGLEMDASRRAGRFRGHLNDAEVLFSVDGDVDVPWRVRVETPWGDAGVGYAWGSPVTLLDVTVDAREVFHLEVTPEAVFPALYRTPHARVPVMTLRSGWLSAGVVSASVSGDELAAWLSSDYYLWSANFSSTGGDDALSLETAVTTPGRAVRLVARKVAATERVFLLSWAPGVGVGLTALRNATCALARLDLPTRSLEAVWTRRDHHGHDATLLWDAARDRTRRLHVTVSHHRDGTAEATLALWPLDDKLVLNVNVDAADNQHLYMRLLKFNVSYGLSCVGFDAEVVRMESLRVAAGFVVSHPAERVFLQTRLTSEDLSSCSLEVAYRNSSTGELRGVAASYLLDRALGEARAALRTPDSELRLRGRLLAARRALELEVGTSPLRPPTLLLAELRPGRRLHAQLSLRRAGRGATLFLLAPEHGRRVAAGAYALEGGARTRETSVVAALNTTRLLWTRVLWSPATLRFLGRELVQDLRDASYAAEDLSYEVLDLLRDDSVGRVAHALAPRVSRFFHEALNVSGQELRLILQDVHDTQDQLALVYHRDDFYLKTIVQAAATLLSSAQETLSAIQEECREMYATVKTSLRELFTLVFVRGLALDEAVSHIQEWFHAFQEVVSMAADNAIRLTVEMRRLQVESRTVIKEAVETVRRQLSALKENSQESLRDLELEVRALVAGVLRLFDPLVSQVQEYVDNVRRASQMVSDKLNDLVSQFTSAMMDVEEVTYLTESYAKLKAWVNEIDVRELAELVVRIVADSVESIVRDVTQTVDNFVVFVGGVSNSSPRQAMSVAFMRKTVNTVYHKVTWLWERYDVNGLVVDTLKVLLEELDDVLAELSGVLGDSSLADVLGAHVVLRPDAGVLEYTQRLPVEWKAFNQLPNFEEVELQRKPVVAAIKDNIQSYVVSSYKELTRNRTLAELLPPFPKQAVVVRGRHFVTFDGRYHALRPDFDGDFLLATDFLKDKFSAFVTLRGQRSSLTLVSPDHSLTVGPGASLRLDGRPTETPARGGATLRALRSPAGLLGVEVGPGVSADCDALGAVCVLQLSGWFFGRSKGLLGTPDNEPSNDLPPPTAWRLPSTTTRRWPKASASSAQEAAPTVPASLCGEYFARQSSPLARCFPGVDPAPFLRLCQDVAVCDASAAYVGVCRKAGVDLPLPSDCVRCESRDGFLLKPGATQTHVGDAPPTSADVALLLLATGDVDHEAVAQLVARLDAALSLHGVSSAKYALVGPDGAAHTAAGGHLWFGAADVGAALYSLRADTAAVAPSEVLALASSLPFRDGAAKLVLEVAGGNVSLGAVDIGQLTEATINTTAASVAVPPGCEQCQCVAGHDGVGRLTCKPCSQEPTTKMLEDFLDDVDYLAYEDDESLLRELLSS